MVWRQDKWKYLLQFFLVHLILPSFKVFLQLSHSAIQVSEGISENLSITAIEIPFSNMSLIEKNHFMQVG